MEEEELNKQIEILVSSPENMQEFANIASHKKNWRKIDKNIKLPRNVGFTEQDCPVCFDPIRLIYEKFTGFNTKFPLICPHCHTKITCKSEFTGYTNEVYLEE